MNLTIFNKNPLTIVYRAEALSHQYNSLLENAMQLLSAIVINQIFEVFIKHMVESYSRNSLIKKSISQAIRDTNISLTKMYFNEHMIGIFNNILQTIIYNTNIFKGDATIGNGTMSYVFIGPPGTGKTSLMQQMQVEIIRNINNNFGFPSDFLLGDLKNSLNVTTENNEIPKGFQNWKESINPNCSDEHRSVLIKQRELHANGKLVVLMMISGAFFDKYNKNDLAVFNGFIDYILNLLKEDRVVILCIDEVDALICPNGSSIRSDFLVGLDKLTNFNRFKEYKGMLFLISTTNGNDKFDYAMSRRIFQEVVPFEFVSSMQQYIIFSNKFEEKKRAHIANHQNNNNEKDENYVDVPKRIESINLKNIQKVIEVFNKKSSEFTGAEIENILNNFFIVCVTAPDSLIQTYGDTLEQQMQNLLILYFFKEAWKIWKIRKGYQQHHIKNFITFIKNKLKYPFYVAAGENYSSGAADFQKDPSEESDS